MHTLLVIGVSVILSTLINGVLIKKTVDFSAVEVKKIMKRYEKFISEHLDQ